MFWKNWIAAKTRPHGERRRRPARGVQSLSRNAAEPTIDMPFVSRWGDEAELFEIPDIQVSRRSLTDRVCRLKLF
jgi:hypothetical protein